MAWSAAWLALLTAVCVVVAVALEVRRRKVRSAGAIPRLPFFSVFGNIDHVALSRRHVLCLGSAKKYGGVFLGRILLGDVYFVADGALVYKLLTRSEQVKTPKYRMIVRSGGSKTTSLIGLLTAESARKRRNAVRHGFSANALRAKEPSVLQLAMEACEVLRRECEMGTRQTDLRDTFARFTLDVIFRLMLDIDLGSMRDAPGAAMVRKAYDKSITVIPMLIATVPFLKHATFLRSVRSHKEISMFNTQSLETIYNQFKRRYEQADEEEKQNLQATILYTVMCLDEEKDPDFSPIGELKMFVAAGFESTAHSLVWVIYDLMRNQKIYERLVSELDAAVMTYGEQEYLKSSATIPYLEACIKESQRMHGAGGLGERVVTVSGGVDVGDGMHIPERATVTFPMFAIHRWEKNWERPDEFIPERWLTDEHKLLTTEAAYFGCGEIADTTTFLPFFTGSRNCVGIYLALLEMRIILKLALRKLHFSPVYIREEEDFGEQSVTLKPTWGRWAYVKERSLS